jgi:Na+-transporting methylmalonyl-CoA/oxaloacetate decarboxylase gamma subunit
LFDFQLITANNGWAMAIVGILIVMSGLSILAFIISQLHKLIAVFEKKTITAGTASPFEMPEKFPDDMQEVARLYEPLVKQLSSSFSLDELYALTTENKYPHPHLTIRSFREAGILIPRGDGIFTWKLTT